MVDAINGTSSIKPNDLTINWNDCTANEVIEYKDEGQDVPTAILTWAEDMAKNEGADEITYEMSMGNSDPEAIQQTQPVDAGSQLKQELDEQNLTPIQQAQIFGQKSDEQSNMVRALEDEMESILVQSEAATANVEEYSTNLLSQIQTLRAKQEQVKNDKSSLFAPMQANQIEAQIKQLGNLGLSEIDNMATEIYSATNGIGDALTTASDTTSIGNQSVAIGTQLWQTDGNFFAEAAQVGRTAIQNGTNAIRTAQEGSVTFNDTADSNIEYEDRTDASRGSITNASGATGVSETEENTDAAQETTTEETQADENTESGNQNVTDKFEQDRQAEESQAELDPTLADTSITTDPNEILKRKERKGLV